jgi:hypothetical protein
MMACFGLGVIWPSQALRVTLTTSGNLNRRTIVMNNAERDLPIRRNLSRRHKRGETLASRTLGGTSNGLQGRDGRPGMIYVR